MANEYRIPGYKVAGYKIIHVNVATRDEIATYINNISDSALGLTVSGNTATFTFPAASAGVATAIAYGIKGEGNLVSISAVRNTGYGHIYWEPSPVSDNYHGQKKYDRGWNYQNWIDSYWPSSYTFSRPICVGGTYPNKSGKHKLAITKDAFGTGFDKLTYEELRNGRAVRDLTWLKNRSREVGSFDCYIGLIYWNKSQQPCKFKMKKV